MIKKSEYKVVYDYKGHQIEAGQNRWIPDRGIAEKILANFRSRPLYKDRSLYLIEQETERELKPCRSFNGKEVLNRDHFYVDALSVGDYVDKAIVDDFINACMPASMRRDCAQLGEPYSTRVDKDGRHRSTYLTFKQVGDGVFEYCGDCFRGMNKVTGTIPDYLM